MPPQATRNRPPGCDDDLRVELVAGGRRVDLEFAGQRRAGPVEAPADHTVAGAVGGAVPDHRDVAAGIGGDRRDRLRGGRDGDRVDVRLAADRRAVRRVALQVDLEGAVGVAALVGHHEPAVRQHGHVVVELAVRGRRVDPELGALRYAAGIEALAVDAVAGAVLAIAAPR